MAGVKITGLQVAQAQINKIAAMPSDEQLNLMGNIGVAGIQSNFEGNPLDWQDLKPATWKRKSSTQILVEKGLLKKGSFYRIASQTVRKIISFINNDAKAAFHQAGTKWMPARPHVVLRKEVVDEMLDILRRGLNGR